MFSQLIPCKLKSHVLLSQGLTATLRAQLQSLNLCLIITDLLGAAYTDLIKFAILMISWGGSMQNKRNGVTIYYGL